jgi:hypothetical protein
MQKRRNLFIRILLAILSAILYILSLPMVRNWIWKKTVEKSRAQVIDAKARIVKK